MRCRQRCGRGPSRKWPRATTPKTPRRAFSGTLLCPNCAAVALTRADARSTPAVQLVLLPYTCYVWVAGIPARRAAAQEAAERAAATAAAALAAEEDADLALAERVAARKAKVEAMKAAEEARERAWQDKVAGREAAAAAQHAAETAAREKERSAARSARRSLRKLCEGNATIAADEQLMEGVEFACSVADSAVLTALVSTMQRAGDEKTARDELAAKVKSLEEEALAEARRRSEQARAAEAARQEAASKRAAFSAEELRLLAQGLNKFPGGTMDRWEKIAFHVGRSVTEVSAQAKMINQKIAAGGGRADAGAIQRAAATAALKKKPSGAAAGAAEKEQEAVVWSESEQRTLESGLKAFPSAMKDERWAKIAETLPGKSAADCKSRFKAIAKALKAKKLKDS